MGGGGGETVAFRGELSADQSGITSATWTKVELDEASVDTDNAFADGKFMPSVSGYYQVNGGIRSSSTLASRTVAGIYKNGSGIAEGSSVDSEASYGSVVSDVIYLNGTTDYIEFMGYGVI